MNQAENLTELVKIVDKNNELLGYETRKVMREKAHFHQASYILVINKQGQICTHLRHQDKLWCGGYWNTVFGGCVAQGEDYQTNAQKELEEEAGIKTDQKLEELDCFCYSSEKQNVWGKVFWIFYDGEINFQKEEVQDTKWRLIKEIKSMKDQFTPDGNMAFDLFLKFAFEKKDKYPQFRMMFEEN